MRAGNIIRRMTALVTMAVLLLQPAVGRACFSIVVGKNASAEGCVLVAHNEDDTPPQIVNHHKVPRRTHPPGQYVELRGGGRVEQVERTWACLWSEMPGMLFSDSYVNEWGVCVTSDNCPSREDRGELTDGGIGAMLRRLVAERARTAREGVLLAGRLVERFGYIAPGRTYIIADPEEGWLFCAVQGKRWLARRVADDEVAMVANTYTVRQVDLTDEKNVLASDGIVDYAIERGWYDPNGDGGFDFAAVYADPTAAANPINFGRQAAGLSYVVKEPIADSSDLPFSVVPSRKLAVAELIRILRHNRGEGPIRALDGAPIECDVACAICRGSTQTSFVARLSTKPSRETGIVYWTCLGPPETSVFIPFPFGISAFPRGFRGDRQRPSQTFDRMVGQPFRPDPTQAFWTFSNFRAKAQGQPEAARQSFLTRAEAVEDEARQMLPAVEEAAVKLTATNEEAAGRFLANFSAGLYLSALEVLAEMGD